MFAIPVAIALALRFVRVDRLGISNEIFLGPGVPDPLATPRVILRFDYPGGENLPVDTRRHKVTQGDTRLYKETQGDTICSWVRRS